MKPFIAYHKNPFCWLIGVFIVFLAIMLLTKMARADELWRISHYDACYKCCGKTDGIMASGKRVYLGAVACNWLPFGTKLSINGKVYTVEDRGAKSIFGTKQYPKKAIDIYCLTHKEALNKGVYYTEVKIL